MMTTCRFRALALISVAGLVLTFALAQETWKEYVYEADGFAISMPQEPVLSKSSVDTKAGPVEMHNYMVELGQDAALLVSMADYGSSMQNADPKAVLQGGKEGAMRNTNSHLISERPLTLQGYPGLGIETENDTMHFSARFYMVNTRLYQTVAVTSIGKPYTGTNRFHESLRLVLK